MNSEESQILKLSTNQIIADKERELEFLWLLYHEPDIKDVIDWQSWRSDKTS